MISGLGMSGRYRVECIDKQGCLKWVSIIENTIVNVGLQHILDVVFTGSPSADSSWYVGLAYSGLSQAAADTLASHAGWTECAAGTVYTQANRVEWTEARTDQKLSNSSNKATFSIDTDATLGGAFLANTNAGTAGVLMSVGPFSGGAQAVTVGDTVNVTLELSAASV